MNITGFINLLLADPTTSGLVGTRVYKAVLPRGYQLPAVAVHRYGGDQDYQMSGPVDIREDRIQFDAYGDTPDDCEATAEAIRALLVPYTGTLTDGTVVQACYLERDMDLPFLANADSKGIANRTCLGFRVISGQ